MTVRRWAKCAYWASFALVAMPLVMAVATGHLIRTRRGGHSKFVQQLDPGCLFVLKCMVIPAVNEMSIIYIYIYTHIDILYYVIPNLF